MKGDRKLRSPRPCPNPECVLEMGVPKSQKDAGWAPPARLGRTGSVWLREQEASVDPAPRCRFL